MHFVQLDISKICLSVLRSIRDKPVDFYGQRALPLFIDNIKEKIAQLEKQVRTMDYDHANWSIFTYKFAFLLTSKKYFKVALPLEKKLVQKFISNSYRSKLVKDIKEKVKADFSILENLSSQVPEDFRKGFNALNALVTKEYTEEHHKHFLEYDNAIANLIDKY